MTRAVVIKNLERTINWCGDARKASDQWMDNFHACRGDLMMESHLLELWRAAAIVGWVLAVAGFACALSP